MNKEGARRHKTKQNDVSFFKPTQYLLFTKSFKDNVGDNVGDVASLFWGGVASLFYGFYHKSTIDYTASLTVILLPFYVSKHTKLEGVISLNEFRYNPNLKVGDKVEVVVDTREDRTR